jgi:hypothetical protein
MPASGDHDRPRSRGVPRHERVGHGLGGLAGGNHVESFVRGKLVRVERAVEKMTGVARAERGVEDGVEVGTGTQ